MQTIEWRDLRSANAFDREPDRANSLLYRGQSRMVLLHGFIKKTQKTPREDLNLAKSNKAKHQRGLQ